MDPVQLPRLRAVLLPAAPQTQGQEPFAYFVQTFRIVSGAQLVLNSATPVRQAEALVFLAQQKTGKLGLAESICCILKTQSGKHCVKPLTYMQ